jgi:acyl-CoA synthetase (NDP forming)
MKVLTEPEAEQLLSEYLPIANSVLVNNVEKAEAFAKKSGYPVILKLISPEALHKTEFKGVRKADDPEDLLREFKELAALAKKKRFKSHQILVQEFLQGREVIIGLKKDPTFGHVILFGIGGIFVEAIKDVSFRVCPITTKDAEEMIEELKAKKVLFGFRGMKPVNLNFLKKMLVAASKIPEQHPEIQELDINPFIINEKTGKVVDARAVIQR